MIAPNVSLMAASHPLIAHERLGLMCGDDGLPTIAENAEPIRIGNNVWIGCNVTGIGGDHWQRCGHWRRERGDP